MRSNESPLKYQTVKDYVLMHIERNHFMPHERLPSENELAEKLGVSSITVRKALSDLVNEGCIYRIRGKGSFIADREPMPTPASNLVVFIFCGTELTDSSILQLIKGIQSYLTQHDFKLIIEFVDNNTEHDRDLVLRLLQLDIVGLLIYSSEPHTAKSYLAQVKNSGKACVMLDRYPVGMPMSCVSSNNHDGAFEAVDYLINLGHKHIGIALYESHLSSEIERFAGYRDALEMAGIPLDDNLFYMQKDLNYDELAQKIRKGEMSALFCINDRVALEAIEKLSELNLRIPQDLSIMGFDDFESSKYAKIPLSTVKQYFDLLGIEAAKLLLETVNHSYSRGKKILLPTSLVIRESTSAPRDSSTD